MTVSGGGQGTTVGRRPPGRSPRPSSSINLTPQPPRRTTTSSCAIWPTRYGGWVPRTSPSGPSTAVLRTSVDDVCARGLSEGERHDAAGAVMGPYSPRATTGA